MQHFCQEIEARLNVELDRGTVGERIKEAFQRAGLQVTTSGKGYSALREILEQRDAIEHPKQENVFNSHPNNWDHVPLSWLLTERALAAFERWSAWFDQATKQWAQHPVHVPRKVTLTVERGQKSTRQAKKPPRQKHEQPST